MTRFLPLFFCLILAGCATPMVGPRTYDDGAISFAIPARWKVSMQKKHDGRSFVVVEDPENAIVFISSYPVRQDPGLQKFAADFSKSMVEETPIGELTMSGFKKFTDGAHGPALREKMTITFAGVQVPHQRTYRKRAGSTGVYYIFTQVSDEDAPATQKGFREILDTFSIH